jgi:hypothetical protein
LSRESSRGKPRRYGAAQLLNSFYRIEVGAIISSRRDKNRKSTRPV